MVLVVSIVAMASFDTYLLVGGEILILVPRAQWLENGKSPSKKSEEQFEEQCGYSFSLARATRVSYTFQDPRKTILILKVYNK